MVALAKAGDQAAFGVIYEEFLNPIFRFIIMQVRDQALAEDLTQDVFVKVFSRLDQFGNGGDNFKAWLYQIARTTTLDWFKKKKLIIVDQPEEVFGNIESPHGNPLVLALNKENQDSITQALAKLSHNDREVLVLYYVSDLNYAEIAALLKINEEAVRQRKSRGLKALRIIMGR